MLISPPLLASTMIRTLGFSGVLEPFSTAPTGFTKRPLPGASHSAGRVLPIRKMVPAAISSAKMALIWGANRRELSWFGQIAVSGRTSRV